MRILLFNFWFAGFAAVARAKFWTSENAPLEYHYQERTFWNSAGKELLPDVPSPDELEEPPKFSGLTTLENFPSPFTHARICHHHNDESSYVCDPDHILTLSEINHLEDRLALLRETSLHPCGELGNVPYQFVVALIEKLPIGVDNDVLATELLERWGIGHKECHDGLIMIYSKEDNNAILSYDFTVEWQKWKRGVEPALSFRVYSVLKRDFNVEFNKPPLAKSLNHAVDLISPHLSGDILSPRQTNQLIVVLAIATLIALMYCGCIINIVADQLPSAKDDPVLRRQISGE